MDMVQIGWAEAGCPQSEQAIMLEIWDRGALLQTSLPIPRESSITITAPQDGITARVSECARDNSFGFLIQLDVDEPAKWFPGGYAPKWLLPVYDTGITISPDRVC
jgi:hypothetical protein